MLWATIFGYFFYGDFPDVFTIIGSVIVALSGIYVLKKQNI